MSHLSLEKIMIYTCPVSSWVRAQVPRHEALSSAAPFLPLFTNQLTSNIITMICFIGTKTCRLYMCSSRLDSTEAITGLQIWLIASKHTVILYSKITQITAKRPQITPDHTRSSREHAFGTYFLTGPRKNSLTLLSPFPPQTEGTPPYLKWPFSCCFSFQK